MAAYTPSEWHTFFMGSVGAAAALLGLLFVAISMNLQQILKFPKLPGRAAGTLGILMSALVVSSFGLAPGQSHDAFGIEIIASATVAGAQSVWVTLHRYVASDPISWTLEPLIELLLPSLAFIAGGLSLMNGGGGGLYWVLAGTLLSFLAASISAWVLLIEILR
jgi:modulator of FtsH protease